METLDNILHISHDWALERIQYCCDMDQSENAYSIQQEFSEWLNPDIQEHDVISIQYIGEDNDWS